MPRQPLLLDACVVIGLCATGHLDKIAVALDIQFLVAAEAAREVGKLRDDINGDIVEITIDLTAFSPNDLEIIKLTDTEAELFVELAQIIDDGEAATLAIAQIRGIALATDDRKARKICQARGISDPWSTLQLLRKYATSAGLDTVTIGDLLRDVRAKASYVPGPTHPEYSWWLNHMG